MQLALVDARAPPAAVARPAVDAAATLDDLAGGGMQTADHHARRAFRHRRGAAGALWDPNKEWREQHRTVGCGRHVTDSTHGVEILRRKDGTGARFRGLHTCGSIWACPVCARKITNHRREELRLAHAAHARAGGACYLVTLTFPHQVTDKLDAMMVLFLKALQRWQNGRAYDTWFQKHGRVGSVKGLEVTWGDLHGWHPHVHIVVFAQPGMQADTEAIGALRDAWVDALLNRHKRGPRRGQKRGDSLAEPHQLNDMLLHAFDFQAGDYVTQYIAKMGREPAPTSREIDTMRASWGIHSEATSFLDKNQVIYRDAVASDDGKTYDDYHGLTQFGLLSDSVENPDAAQRADSKRLFRTFVSVFDGKRQLTWSPGLKKSLNIKEIEDEEIARGEHQKPEEEFCVRIFSEAWKLLLQHDKHDAPFLALHAAAKYGDVGVNELLRELRTRAPPGKGGFIELGMSHPDRWAR